MRDLTLQCRQSLSPWPNDSLLFGNRKSSSSSLKCYYTSEHPKCRAIMDHVGGKPRKQNHIYKSTMGYTQTTSMMVEFLVAPRITKVILDRSKTCIAIDKPVYLHKTSPHLKKIQGSNLEYQLIKASTCRISLRSFTSFTSPLTFQLLSSSSPFHLAWQHGD